MRPGTFAAALISAALVGTLVASPADAAGPAKLGRIQYDSPGSDRGSNASLNAEWATIANKGAKTRTLTGWTLRDTAGHVFRFPTFKLKPGKSVRIHTGRGSNDANDLYWRQDWYVWNNDGDKAILKNKAGTKADSCSWGDGPGATNC